MKSYQCSLHLVTVMTSPPCFRHDGSLGFLSNRTSDSAELDSNTPSKQQVWILSPHNELELKQITNEPLGVNQFKFASHGDLLAIIARGQKKTALITTSKAHQSADIRKCPSGITPGGYLIITMTINI